MEWMMELMMEWMNDWMMDKWLNEWMIFINFSNCFNLFNFLNFFGVFSQYKSSRTLGMQIKYGIYNDDSMLKWWHAKAEVWSDFSSCFYDEVQIQLYWSVFSKYQSLRSGTAGTQGVRCYKVGSMNQSPLYNNC